MFVKLVEILKKSEVKDEFRDRIIQPPLIAFHVIQKC